ncbi:MAG: sigma-54-dependent Fis family transcriptional regulator, partial [Spirochaetales bacterium]|nr:sigma-54-dependent Fis family transcriptional regulator [Spirochaetales bacterium]
NLEKLSISVANAIKQRQLFIENRDLQSKLAKIGAGSDKVMGKSSKMTKIYDIIQSVAPTKSSVLILGENGVGKEVVSNMIYELSKRNDKPFIKVHCAALSESLLESELFGHEKGAFTGAIKQKKGRFELADGGTLFLDEIGEISQSIQVKLLRVLQEQEFERVGGEETIKVDVRIISATNKNLQELVANGTFREDLYYRLNVVQIDVPPLRERKEDIPLFVTSMLSQISKKNDKVITGISNKAMSCLYNYDWPGNVRELQNVLESSIVMCKSDVIDVPDLPPPLRSAYSENNSVVIEMPATMDAIERVVIAHTLKLANGNKTKAAEMLAMNRKTLHNKIEEYKLE